MSNGNRVLVLAMDAPGRYIVGEGKICEEGGRTVAILSDPAHAVFLNERLSFQPVSFIDTFTADLSAYVGYGRATEEMDAHYKTWVAYRRNPPSFEVEEDEISDSA